MQPAPKSFRLHIGLFGRRNAGKSSVLNSLVRQQVAIVSPIAGTTTDPVEKPMELLPLGPVLFIDTAGIDDVGTLGRMRVEKTCQVFDRTDVGVLVAPAGEWSEFEESILQELRDRKTPMIVVFNKADLASPREDVVARLREAKIPYVSTIATNENGTAELREALIAAAPEDFINTPPIVADLIPPGELVVLVVPIDKEAPKGRIILPQVQTIRDLLDADASCIVVKENGLREAIERLRKPPALVVTDSQAFQKVAEDTPSSIPITSFSILFARRQGDLNQFVEGAAAIERLRPGDRVLIAEACTHHPIGEDIGRVKIPQWLNRYVGGELEFHTTQGHDFPADLDRYRLVIHCGACMWNRRAVLTRLLRCRRAGVPISNYGLVIAYTFGILDRALAPFPEVLAAYHRIRSERGNSENAG